MKHVRVHEYTPIKLYKKGKPMKPTQRHTALPWHIKYNTSFKSSDVRHGSHCGYELLDKNNIHICYDLEEVNALFIVKAVNNHEKLVEALKEALTLIKRGNVLSPSDVNGESYWDSRNKIEQALQSVEKETV